MITSIFDPRGVCTRRRAVTIVGERRVRKALATGELASPWAGVLVDPARAADPLTIVAAATLLGGHAAVVTGATAAHLHGCTAAALTPVHLVVPYEHPLRSRPGVIVHNGRALETDRIDLHGLPVLALERVVSDLLCTARAADALAVVDQALRLVGTQRQAGFRTSIRRRLAARPDPRGTRRAAQVLAVASERAESPAESWLRWRIIDEGFPVPEVNWWVESVGGERLYRVDLAWPALRILVEYDGHAAHAGRDEPDEARRVDLRRRGWIVVSVRADDLRSPTRFVAELHGAFAARGVGLRLGPATSDVPRRRRVS